MGTSTGGISDTNKSAIQSITAVAIFAAMLFSIVDFFAGYLILGAILVAVSILLTPYYFSLRLGNNTPYPREVIMVSSVGVFIGLFVEGGIAATGIYWSLLYPFVAFLMMGRRLGWYWLAVFALVYGGVVALHAMDYVSLPYSYMTILLHAAEFLFFAMVAHIFATQSELRYAELTETNNNLLNTKNEIDRLNASLENKIRSRTSELLETNARLTNEVVEKERALEKMRSAELKFERAQRMEAIGNLVGGIAHDFNNLITGITANLYMLQRNVKEESASKRLEKIGELSMHAADMIRQLLTFARKDKVEMGRFDLRSFVQEAFKLAKVSIPASIKCHTELCSDSVFIKGSATQIQQVLMNLMNNARDALDGVEDPAITVSLSKCDIDDQRAAKQPLASPGHYAKLSVCDNGAGIDDEALERIFEPFYTTKEVGKGTGLGLAMIYGAVQGHDGFIEVQSRSGEGASFHIYLPIMNEATDAASTIEDAIINEGNGEMVLLVEDDDVVRECLCDMLAEINYQVMTAVNGQEAIALFEQNRNEIDIVLTDLVMPVMGGVAAANHILEINQEARIVFMTGYDRDNELTAELVSDWHHVLRKPVVLAELSRALFRQLRASS